MIEKNIVKTENENPYEIKAEKQPEIMLEIAKNYRVCGHVYQVLFYKIAETFNTLCKYFST